MDYQSKIYNRSASNSSNTDINFDKIVNLTSLKMKELHNKKIELGKAYNHHKGQRNSLETDKNHYITLNQEKESQLNQLVNNKTLSINKIR